MEQETDLSRLIDQNVFESKQHCVISYGAREGKMNCNLCKDVVKKAKAKPEVEFINAYPGGGVNYHRGVVILTDSLLKKDFKTMTPSVGKFYQQMLQEHGINNFYALPNVKCELAPLDLKATGKITSNCLELSRHIIVNRLKPKVVVTDDVATFNYYTGMRFMSAGKVVNHVMWSPDLNCYLLLILNVHKYLAEAAISKERQLEQVKLNCLNRSFTIISKILKGEYEEQIIRCSKVDYRKITKHSPASDQELMFSTLAAQKELAIDIETTGLVPGGGLRPWDSRITSLAITYDIGKSYVYPWQYIVDNRDRFQSLFSNPAITKIWANGAFDLSHLNYAGFEFVGPHIDILVWNYLYRNGLDYDLSLMDTYQSTRTKSRDTNTLKFLARIYSDLGFYEKEIKAAGGIVKAQEGLEESADDDSDEDSETSDVGQGLLFENLMIQDVNPESNLRLADAAELKMVDEPKSTEMTAVDRYNAADTDATFRARIALEKRLDKKLMDFYWLLMEPLIFEVIVPIYLSGIRVDLEYLDTLEKRYFGDGTTPGEMQLIEKQWVEAMRKEILESELMTADHVLDIYKKDLKNYEATYSKPLPNTKEELIDHIELNINSPTKILKTYKALGYLTSDAKSVDGGVLKHLVSKGIPSAVAKSAYQPVSKLYTTYVKAIKDKQIDGFIHCIFNTFFTTTGRLCVAGDTEVLTDRGPVRIDQLHPTLGIKVLTHKGRWMPVIQKIYKGQETMYEVETECGEKITCTAGHRFLTPYGWKHLSDLKAGSSTYSLAGHPKSSEVGFQGKGFQKVLHTAANGSKAAIRDIWSNLSSVRQQSEKVLGETGSQEHHVCSEGYQEKTIRSITEVGVQDVWDIEVAEDHSYVANGFINHNSSSDPNMQNIPANDTVKNIFVSRPGYSFIDLDYSQAELRVVGEYANEQTFIDAYVNDKDIHWEMVMKMFNVTFPYQPKKLFFEHVQAVAKHLGLEVDSTFTSENWAQYLQQVKDGTFAFEGPMKEVITTIEKWTKYRDRAKCVSPESLVYVNDEYTRIGSLIPRDLNHEQFSNAIPDNLNVWTGDSNISITQYYRNSNDKRILVLSGKCVVVCSENHLIQMDDGSLKRAADISPGDVLKHSPAPKLHTDETKVTVTFNPSEQTYQKEIFSLEMSCDWAYWAGVFTGDGCYSKSFLGISAGIGGQYDEWRRILTNHANSLGLKLIGRENREHHSNHMYMGSIAVVKLFEKLELVSTVSSNEAVHGKKTLRVPTWIWRGGKQYAMHFLAGLFDTDGNISNHSVNMRICTKDYFLLQDLSVLADACGLTYSLSKDWNKTYEKYYYRITFSSESVREFARWGICKCPWKIPRIAESLEKKKINRVPVPNIVRLVTSLPPGPLVDIEVNSPDHLYWVNNTVTHNTLNFSILYGSSEYGLARNIYKETYDYVTDTKRKEYLDECKGLLESWFKSVPNIKKWLEDNFAFAKKHGYVETIYGRRRYLVFSDSNYWKFQNSARREAGNTPIQSTASDICCLAAVEFQRFIRRPEHIADGCRIVNIVHDNILAEVPDEKTEYYFNALKHIMENVVNPLKIVPLKVDGQIIKRWGK